MLAGALGIAEIAEGLQRHLGIAIALAAREDDRELVGVRMSLYHLSCPLSDVLRSSTSLTSSTARDPLLLPQAMRVPCSLRWTCLGVAFTGQQRRSAKSLPCRLPRNTQRRPNLGPANFARPKNVHDPLELITLALEGILDRLQVSQQALGW